MIKYKLVCKDCELNFDSWFASSNEYERLKKKKLLNCHKCNSVEVEKTRFSGSDGLLNDVIPLKPLLQFTKLTSVLLSYVIISSFILNIISKIAVIKIKNDNSLLRVYKRNYS